MENHTLRTLAEKTNPYITGEFSANKKSMIEDGICFYCGGNLIATIVEQNMCKHGIGRNKWAARCIDCGADSCKVVELAKCACYIPF